MKTFFTYEQQIEKLKTEGLVIEDEIQATTKLKFEGYYNLINGYSPIFKNKDRYITNTTFENITTLYDFDKTLRSIVYKYTSTIECHVKALIAHEFSRVHGVYENSYLNKESFSNNKKCEANVIRLIEECKQTIKDALNKNSNKYREYIAHNYNTHGHVPMWVLVRAISFGTTSILYKNLKDAEKENVAANYGINAAQLANMLEVVVSFRNIVAHGERTFYARLPRTRLSTELAVVKHMCITKNPKGENKFGRNDFLSLLICCKYLLPNLEFASMITELESALDNLKNFQTPQIFARVKTEMGIKSNSWKLLPKLKK